MNEPFYRQNNDYQPPYSSQEYTYQKGDKYYPQDYTYQKEDRYAQNQSYPQEVTDNIKSSKKTRPRRETKLNFVNFLSCLSLLSAIFVNGIIGHIFLFNVRPLLLTNKAEKTQIEPQKAPNVLPQVPTYSPN